jgi:hypothetical protein
LKNSRKAFTIFTSNLAATPTRNGKIDYLSPLWSNPLS